MLLFFARCWSFKSSLWKDLCACCLSNVTNRENAHPLNIGAWGFWCLIFPCWKQLFQLQSISLFSEPLALSIFHSSAVTKCTAMRFSFVSLCIPNIMVCVIPNFWEVTEVSRIFLAVLREWFVLYLIKSYFLELLNCPLSVLALFHSV